MKKIMTFLIICFFLSLSTSFAGEADVVKVEVTKNDKNTYTFSVTVSHKDTGWKHYSNKWEIVGEDGIVFGTRILQHPHVNEQPFTRSLSGVEIPEGIKSVTIRAHDSVHEYGGKVIIIDLP